MTYSFNLIDQPWIPCARMDGRVAEFSLRETLEKAHELRGLQGDSPLETAAMYRLLLAVIHSALRGPANKTEWSKLWKAKQLDIKRVNAYLDKWHSRFDLFDEKRPFYQTKDDQMVEKNALQLTHGMGTANELFVHETVIETIVLSCAQATRMLLAGQLFGLGGLVHPKFKNLTSAPLLRGITFLVEGNTLFETLLLNSLQYTGNKPMPNHGNDAPTWEMEKPFENREQTNGYLDYLTWQNRKLFLVPEGEEAGKAVIGKIFIARGLDLDKGVEDPFKQYSKKDTGWRHLPFTENRSLWRDSHTLLKRNKPDDYHPPQTFDWLSLLLQETDCLEYKQIYRYMALGAGVHYKDAKIYFYRHENMPLPLSYFADENLVEKLTTAITYAEDTKSGLWRATSTMAKILIASSSDEKGGRQPDPGDVAKLLKHWGAEINYWAKLETAFMKFLEDLPNDSSAMDRWKERLQQTAWDALAGAERFAGESTTALKAAVKARGMLAYELKKVFSEIEIPKEATA